MSRGYDELVAELAALRGIEPEYVDIHGRRHPVSTATQRALLVAMGEPVGDGAAVAAAITAQRRRHWGRLLDPMVVVHEGETPATVTLRVPARMSAATVRWTLTTEGGEQRGGTARAGELRRLEAAEVDGEHHLALALVLAQLPPPGYHRLEVRVGDTETVATLAVAPARCHQPSALSEGGRVWGPALQLYALRSQRSWGIGDLADLETTVTQGAPLGAHVVGVNPLHALFPTDPARASPYSPSSRLFLNVLYIAVEAVPEFDHCEAARRMVAEPAFRQRLHAANGAEMVDYEEAAALKWPVLEALYRHFREHHLAADTPRARAFREWVRAGGEALQRHARFEALQAHLRAGDPAVWGWPAWPAACRDPDSPAVARFAAEHAERVGLHQYLQWLADEQLAQAARQARERGLVVGLYRDLAVGADRGGSETWSNQRLYALQASFGAPPDDYALEGQDWGLPPPIPQALIEQGYAPFLALLRANMRHAGALRIDHVMALRRLFWIPPGARAAEGAYVRYPFADLVGLLALESHRHGCLVVGEDLGTVPPEVPAALAPRGVLSCRLLYFEKDERQFTPPARYPRQALVGIGSHDLPTLAGYWLGEDIAERAALGLFPSDEERDRQVLARAQDRARLLLALEREGLLPDGVTVDPASCPQMTPELAEAIHRYVARTPCEVMAVQLEDVTGQLRQVNLPGTSGERPNWRHRLAGELGEVLSGARMRALAAAINAERPPPPPRRARAGPDIPRATYRLQLHRGFGFADAAAIAPYLARLGVSHCYCSPCLKARAGSTHGYDIVDHNEINPELGGRDQYWRFVDVLHRHGLGQVLDIVPNHMGVGGDDNQWWLDVLENGPASAFAAFFDIDWEPAKPELRGKVLLPVLGDHYGRVLESGGLVLGFDAAQGAFAVRHHNHLMPLDPATYPLVLTPGVERLAAALGAEHPDVAELASLVTAFRNLPGREETDPGRLGERRRDKELNKQRLAALCARSDAVRAFIDDNVRRLNGRPGEPASFDELHALLEQQAWRPAYWRVAADEINYRRFFDINDLAALRMEDPEVFEATHRLVLELVRRGGVDGLRIDHPDGLYDPAQYLRRLQAAVLGGAPALADDVPRALYVVVEKILAPWEHLPGDWPVFGTTGYDFANLVTGLLVHAPAERAMASIYRRFAGNVRPFDELVHDCKRLIMQVSLSSELSVLANRLDRLAESDRRTRDYTLTALREALAEVAACFPVYRTYVAPGHITAADRQQIEWAIAQARRRSQAGDITVFDFVSEVLLAPDQQGREPAWQDAAVEFTQRFQQYTAPVMAKGVEDTAFYRDSRLLALNEVGGDPRRFGVSIAAFHHANRERARRWPHGMLATSTHDSKRSADVRARIAVLSELPGEWQRRVQRWRRINRSRRRRAGDVLAPSGNDEYLLYQTLLGAWPLEPVDEAALAAFRERIDGYMLKAIREAKVHTSWLNPDPAYEAGVSAFVHAILEHPDTRFLADFLPFQRRVAWWGMMSGLSQTLLHLTCPGVPDVYQGDELWTFSLVDPDNRRPVDYTRRMTLLEGLQDLDRAPADRRLDALRAMIAAPADGRIKLWLTWKALGARRARATLFRDGDYLPLGASGLHAERLCAFARIVDGEAAVVLAPRWYAGLADAGVVPVGTAIWGDTAVDGPAGLAGDYIDALTGTAVSFHATGDGARLRVSEALGLFPVALLLRGRPGATPPGPHAGLDRPGP